MEDPPPSPPPPPSSLSVMDASNIVYSRIHKLSPTHSTKILGLLLLQNNIDSEMLRLTTVPDAAIQELVHDALVTLSTQQQQQKDGFNDHEGGGDGVVVVNEDKDDTFMSELEITGFDGDERRKLDGGSGLNGEMSNEFDSDLGLGVSKAEFVTGGFGDGVMGDSGGGDISNGGMNNNHFGLELGFDGLKVGSEVISGGGGYRNGELNNVLKAAEMGFNDGFKSEYMGGSVKYQNGYAFRGEFGGGLMN